MCLPTDDNNIPLHQEDVIVLTPEFDFSNSIFDLEEPNIPTLGNIYNTPYEDINFKLRNYKTLAKFPASIFFSVPGPYLLIF